MPNIYRVEWENFVAGYKPNEAYTSARFVTAGVWENWAINQYGQLICRRGTGRTHSVAFGAPCETLFKFWYLRENPWVNDYSWMITVSDNIRWGASDSVHNDFVPAIAIGSAHRIYGHEQYDHWGFMGNGYTGEIYAIDIGIATPVAYNFYLETPAALSASNGVTNAAYVANGTYCYYVVYVREESGAPVAYSDPSSVTSHTVTGGPRQVNLTGIADATDAQVTHKYIYRTQAGDTVAVYLTSIVDGAGTTTYNDQTPDATMVTNRDTTMNNGYMPTTGELPTSRILHNYQPDWHIAAINGDRLHAVERRSRRIYLSHYYPDVVNPEIYIRNLANYIDAGDGTEEIRAIETLYGNVVMVYFASSIWEMVTDPQVANYSIHPTPAKIGTGAGRSVVNVGGAHYFIGPDRRVYRFAGSIPEWVSKDVQNELDSMSVAAVRHCFAAELEGRYVLAYPAATDANMRILLYDPRIDRWERWNIECTDFFVTKNDARASSQDNGEFYAAMVNENYIRQFGFFDDVSTRLDESTAIPCIWQSNVVEVPRNVDFFTVKGVAVRTQAAASIDVTVTADGTSQTNTITPASRTDTAGQYTGFNGLRGREITVRIESDAPPAIDKITLELIPRRFRGR